MVLDIIGLVIILLLFLRGYSKGIIVALFAVLAILLGITCAMALSARLSGWMLEKGWVSSGWAPVISYLLLFFGVVWLTRLLARLLQKATETILLGLVNRVIGGVLYAFIGITVWSSLLWLMNMAHLLTPETIVHSRTYSWLQPVAPWVFEQAGRILPFAKTAFADMRTFFNGVNAQLPEHVGTPR